MKASTSWLRNADISPKVAGNLVALQDRTIFMNIMRNNKETRNCHLCKNKKTSVDHLATKCHMLLDRNYKKRHDSITKMIHFNLCKEYNLTRNTSLNRHNVTSILENEKIKLFLETNFTDKFSQTNRPDLILFHKEKKIISLIEIGVTNTELLRKREIEKTLKYKRLARNIFFDIKIKTCVIPLVITWDGIVTKNFDKNLKFLGLKNFVPYIQKNVLKNTFESVKVIKDIMKKSVKK